MIVKNYRVCECSGLPGMLSCENYSLAGWRLCCGKEQGKVGRAPPLCLQLLNHDVANLCDFGALWDCPLRFRVMRVTWTEVGSVGKEGWESKCMQMYT